jgi:hydrogenase nickel incorporation protein HypA/HybF
MHEMSLVRSLLAQAAELVASHCGVAVERIRVEMGPLSGVEPVLVSLAFEQLVESTSCRGAQLVIDAVPLACRCRECQGEFEMHDFRFRCPECMSAAVHVIRGDEFRIVDITIRTADKAATTKATA